MMDLHKIIYPKAEYNNLSSLEGIRHGLLETKKLYADSEWIRQII